MSTTRIGDFRQTEGDDGLFALAGGSFSGGTVDPARAAYEAAVGDLTKLYSTVLQRSPDQPGLDWWASQVSAGNATLDQVAAEFRKSPEYKVVTAYSEALGRYPDKPGLDWWISQTTSQNLSVDQLKKELGNSIEGLLVNPEGKQYKGVPVPRFTDQYGFQEDSGTVVRSAEQQLRDWVMEQDRLSSLTPAQKAIEGARYTQNLEGGNQVAYNPVKYEGRDWLVSPSGDSLVSLSTNQSGLSGNLKRYDVIDGATGKTTQIVSADSSMWQRFIKALPKLALAAGAVIGGPALLEAAGKLFTGVGGAAVSDAAFIAADAAQLAAQGLSEAQIAQILEFSGVDAFIAADAASLAAQKLSPTQIEQLLKQSGDGLRLFPEVPSTPPTPTTPEPPPTTPPETPTTPPPEVPPTTPPEVPPTVPPETPPVVPPTTPPVVPPEVPTVVPPVTPPVTPTVPGFDYTKLFTGLGDSLLKGFTGIADTLLSGLAGGNQSNAVAGLISAGIGYQQAKAAADDLLKSGQISQQQYNALASNIQGQYNTLGNQFSGMAGDVRQTYNLLSSEAGQNVGEFTPYGITKNLFGPAGENIQASAMRAAQQSFDQAGMTNVDQLSQDYYNKLAALSAPEQQRQRLATEERLRAQGRLGVSGSAYGGTSPELLAQEQAIAQQQLQRELQSRQAALGERGTLLSQGTAALQPATQLGQFGLNTAQQQFANDLLRQQYLTGLKSQGVQGEIALRSRAGDLAARGIESAGVLQRQGLQDALSRQLAATYARANANQQLTQGLFGGATGSTSSGGNSLFGSLLSSMFAPSDTVPGLNMTYAEALSKGLIAP